MNKHYITPLCEDMTLTTPDLMQDALGVLGGSGNTFSDPSAIEAPGRSTISYGD